MVRIGEKVKSGLRLGTKVAVGAAMVGGALLGIKGKGEKKFEEKKEEADQLVGAGKVVAGAVQGIAQAGVRDVKANPLGAKKAVAKSKNMVVGVMAAAKVDPVGAAQQVQFAVAPKVADPSAPTAKIINRAGSEPQGADTRERELNKKQKAAAAAKAKKDKAAAAVKAKKQKAAAPFKAGGKFGKQEGSFKEQKQKKKKK